VKPISGAIKCTSCNSTLVRRGPLHHPISPLLAGSRKIEDPQLAPAEPSDNELAAEQLRMAKAYLDCKARHGALADRVRDPR
jgi:hypothetical protein